MKLHIEQKVYDKVMHWINSTDIEVSGFGKVVFDEPSQTFRVIDAFLVKQEGGASHTDIDPESLGELMFRTKDQAGHLNWWWHSHVNMPVFWSGTDTATIKDLGKQSYIVATVFNKKYEHRSAAYYKATTAFGENFTMVDNIECKIVSPLPTAEDVAAWTAEFTENVTEKKWGYQYTGNVGNVLGLGQRGFQRSSASSPSETPDSDRTYSDKYYDGHDSGYYAGSSYNDEEWGILGYGIEIEAQALNIFAYQLRQAIRKGKDDPDYIRYEQRLEAIEKAEGWSYGGANTQGKA